MSIKFAVYFRDNDFTRVFHASSRIIRDTMEITPTRSSIAKAFNELTPAVSYLLGAEPRGDGYLRLADSNVFIGQDEIEDACADVPLCGFVCVTEVSPYSSSVYVVHG